VAALVFAGCAEDQELASRVQAIKLRQNAEAADMSDARLELSLAGGGNHWCPGGPPAQVRATVHTTGVALQTPLRTYTNGDQPGYLPRTMVKLSASGAVVGPEWILRAPAELGELVSLIGKPVTISGQVTKQPAATATLPVTVGFDCDQTAEFAGRPGRAVGWAAGKARRARMASMSWLASPTTSRPPVRSWCWSRPPLLSGLLPSSSWRPAGT
jgi:hypothetical protein